jgi:AcrR family transcriptional regulator
MAHPTVAVQQTRDDKSGHGEDDFRSPPFTRDINAIRAEIPWGLFPQLGAADPATPRCWANVDFMSTSLHAEGPARDGTAPGVAPHPRRRWAKTGATQQRILNAAIAVFRERGYSAATIGEVVTASGASIGSIYHHFGGKSELFLAIHEHMALTIESRIAEAERSFDAQVRAYLETLWEHRHTVVVLGSDDIPPGFERIYRETMRVWFRDWLSVLDDIDHSAQGVLLGRVIIALLTESAAMLMPCETAADAEPVIDAALACISRLTGV